MMNVHKMKMQLAEDLCEYCEKKLGKHMTYTDLKALKMTAETINELHEVCHVLKKLEDYEEAHNEHMESHYGDL